MTWYNFANFATLFGHCTGMASTSLNFFNNPSELGRIKEGSKNAFIDLELSDARREITYYYIKQLAQPFLDYKESQEPFSSPSMALDQLLLAMQSKDPPILLTVQGKNKHAVTPIALVERENEVWDIWLYDNVYVGEITHLTVDRLNDRCVYGQGVGEIQQLYVVPLSIFTGNQTIVNLTDVQQMIFGTYQIQIYNEVNQRLGHFGNEFINEIPEAYATTIHGESEELTGHVILLPKNHEYSVVFDGENLDTIDEIQFAQFGKDYSVSIDNTTLTPGTKDKLIISENGKSLIYQSGESKGVTLDITYDGNEIGNLFRINEAQVSFGQIIKLESNVLNGHLSIVNESGNSSIYNVEISMLSSEGEQTFIHRNLEISAFSTHIFDTGGWDGSGPITLETDHHSDGQIDEELELSNEVIEFIEEFSLDETLKVAIPGIALIIFGVLVLLIGSIGLILTLKRK